MAPAAAFDRARAFFRSGSFEECVESYEQLFSHGAEFPEEITGETVASARVTFSACLMALGRNDESEAQMKEALAANPQMSSPDDVIFPVKVIDLFFKVRQQFLDTIEAEQSAERARVEAEQRRREELEQEERERVRVLERLAAEELVVSRNERWIAAIPFGAGQFQNGDATLGTLFLATETLLLATTITAVAVELDTHRQAGGGNQLPKADPYNLQLRRARTVQYAAGAGLLLMVGVGIVEAQLNFVPEHRLRTRPRPVPKAASKPVAGPQLRPLVVPGANGAVVGLEGWF